MTRTGDSERGGTSTAENPTDEVHSLVLSDSLCRVSATTLDFYGITFPGPSRADRQFFTSFVAGYNSPLPRNSTVPTSVRSRHRGRWDGRGAFRYDCEEVRARSRIRAASVQMVTCNGTARRYLLTENSASLSFHRWCALRKRRDGDKELRAARRTEGESIRAKHSQRAHPSYSMMVWVSAECSRRAGIIQARRS